LDLHTDPNLRGLAARAFDQVVRGKIAFNQPTSMRVGEAAHIEARIARTSAEELTEGFSGSGAVHVKDVEVSPFLRVALLGNAFEIEPLSTEDQLLLDGGYTQWQWSVVPKHSGTQYLFLRVTLRLEIPNHGTEFLDRIVLTQPIQVAVNPIFMVKQFASANWQWVFGTATPAAAVVGIVSYVRRRRRTADSVVE